MVKISSLLSVKCSKRIFIFRLSSRNFAANALRCILVF
jgi:hypothetical protein